jgi:hypothetical protein
MKLHITEEQAEAKEFPVSSKKRTEEFRDIIAAYGAILCENLSTIIFPTSVMGQTMRFVIPQPFEIAATYNRNLDLNGITITQGEDQYTFDHRSGFRTKFTMAGDGVGDTVKDGRVATLKALISDLSPAKNAREWLRKRATERKA